MTRRRYIPATAKPAKGIPGQADWRKMAQIKPAVTHRVCPGCGYLVTQMEIDLMRFDFKCPRCSKHTMRDFQPVKIDGQA